MTNPHALIGTAAVPLIIAIIHILKYSGLPGRLAPLAALLLGLGAGVLSVWQAAAHGPHPNTPVAWQQAVILGLTWGMAAVGLYESGSTVKKAAGNIPNPYQPAPANWPNAGKTVTSPGVMP